MLGSERKPTGNTKALIVTKFRREYLRDFKLKLWWSPVLEQHYVCTEDGIRLEDGTWVSRDRLKELRVLCWDNKLLRFYIAGLSVLRDSGYGLVGERR